MRTLILMIGGLAAIWIGFKPTAATASDKPKRKSANVKRLPAQNAPVIVQGKWKPTGPGIGFCKGSKGICVIGEVVNNGTSNFILNFPETNESIPVITFTTTLGQVPDGNGGTVEGTFISWTPAN
jgi:hypothetical protein